MTGARQDRLWVGTSWKMTKTAGSAADWLSDLLSVEPARDPRIRRFVVPPYTSIAAVAAGLQGSDILTGAQNIHWQDEGAWTGEVSAPMVAEAGATLVELGHSERRLNFGETDRTVGLKVAAAARAGLRPLVCVGETLDEKSAGQTDMVLARQVEAALAVTPLCDVLFAYEPVWAIGEGGIPADPGYVSARHAVIRQTAARLGIETRCLYGGSVTPENCTALVADAQVDGLFVGRAAWRAAGFADILARCRAVLGRSGEGGAR